MLCFSGCKQNNDSELIKTEAVEAQQTAFVEKEGEVLVPESLRTVQLPIVGDSRVIVIDADINDVAIATKSQLDLELVKQKLK